MPNSVKVRKVLDALYKLGFRGVRQKGSHVFFEHADGRTTSVPMHKEIRIKLLSKIIRKDLGMSSEDFFTLL